MGGKARLDTRKRRTREHVIADLGVNFVERQVLLAGFIAERATRDYGIDLSMTTFTDTGFVETDQVFAQVKATDRPAVTADGSAVAFVVETAHLRTWATETYPVILVVYDAAGDRAFWLYAQRHVQDHKLRLDEGVRVTLRLPTANLLTPDAVREFRGFKRRIQSQAAARVDHRSP